MADAIDLLQCPVCGTFYEPETTPTGRVMPHCVLPETTTVQWLDGEVHVDFEGLYRRMLARYGLTEDVVDPPLTGSILDIEV